MKKFLLALLLIAVIVPQTQAITHWGGFRFDTPENKTIFTYGQLVPLGGRVYLIPQFGATLDFDNEGFTKVWALEPHVAVLWEFGSGWTAGPIMGPSFDAQQNPDGDLVTYLPFAVGGIIAKKNIFSGTALGIDLSTVSVWFGIANKIDIGEELLDNPSQFSQGTAVGLGLAFSVGP